MATVEFDLLCAFETHAVAEIKAILDDGFDIASRIFLADGCVPRTLTSIPGCKAGYTSWGHLVPKKPIEPMHGDN